jgi:hypothetical protein
MTQQMNNNEKRLKLFRHAEVAEPRFLGEGAWHEAWKVVKDGCERVLRIPKEVAYGKRVAFDSNALTAEYAATKLYYQSVNQAVPGAVPDFYEFYVSPDFTYTLESFGGDSLSLHTMTIEQAAHIGVQVGEIYRKTDQIEHGVEGLGYLIWTEEKKLHGSLSGDLHTFVREESDEQLADYKVLCEAYPEIQDDVVAQMLHAATELRNKQVSVPSLVNQDASPENILVKGNRVCLIDPYPIVYAPRGMAGNFMNLYENYFLALSQTERYRKHRFDTCEEQLKAIATGFLEGYCDGDESIIREVRGEQLLQLLETVYLHHQLLSQEELMREDIIRYGDKLAITTRLFELNDSLKQLARTCLTERWSL